MLYELMQRLNDHVLAEDNPHYSEEFYALFNYTTNGMFDSDIEIDGSGLGLYDQNPHNNNDVKSRLEFMKEQIELRKRVLDSALWSIAKELENV